MNEPVRVTVTAPLAVLALAAVNVNASLSESVALMLPLTTPEVGLTTMDGVDARGAELLGAIVAVTVTAREPP